MTSENLVTVPVGTTLDQAIDQFKVHKIEKLLVVDDDFKLRGLITIKDITKMIEFPHACKDELGRLRVGAAVGDRQGHRRPPCRPSSRLKPTSSASIPPTATRAGSWTP